MINLHFQICSLFGMILVLAVYFSKKKILSFETKVFTALSVINLIGIILDIVLVYLGYVNPYHMMVYILNKFYLVYILIWITLFAIYVVFISASSPETIEFKNQFIKYSFVLNIIAVIMIFASPVYLFNQDGVMYSYGPSITSLYIAALFYCVVIFISVLFNIRHIKDKKYLPLLVFIVLILLAFAIRNLNPGLLLTTSIITYINMIMYFTIENPDLKMIDQLESAQMIAEKANRAKSDFLSSMSHEIRTPLNAIMGFSECIKTSNTLEEAKENASDAISAGETLLEIVNSILDISKIESGKLELIETDYNILQLLEKVESLIRGRIGTKSIDFQVHIAEDLPKTLYGDHANIQKILINLLTNAVKYTDSGYVILQVSCVIKENICRLFISVKDSGRGIKKEQINKLFTKFQRLEEDQNTTIEGTGLGLAITKQLVEMMNGNIAVKSTYKKGSEFMVAIDQRVSLTDEINVDKVIEKQLDLSGKHILVVDDNDMNLKVTSKLLSKYHPEVDCVSNGSQAIEKVKKNPNYDLILMDDMMPKMSGVETLHKLQKLKKFHIPTIVLTANVIQGMREKYLKEGFDDYLAKPIEMNQLFQILQYYLSSGKDKLESPNKRSEVLAQKSSGQEEQKTVNVSYQDFSSKKVLIVDDNEMNIKIASKFLSPYHLQVDQSLSGFDCLEKVKEKEYDLIFMDIMMPEMDGVETFHRLKENKNFHTKVIVLTADAIEGAKEKYLKEGFDGYISKPINKVLLDEILNENFQIENQSSALDEQIPEELFDMNQPLDQIKIEQPKEKKTLYASNQQFSSVYVTQTKKSIDYLKENGIDIDSAIQLLGDITIYEDSLRNFVENSRQHQQTLNYCLEKKDLENYAILVHSLKSDSKRLGFKKLADIFFNHELKSKAQNFSFVQSNYEELQCEYNHILEIIKTYLGI